MGNNSISTCAAGKDNAGGFFIRILIFITVAGWLLRLIAAWEMSVAGDGINNMFTPPAASDLATYMALGKACAAGDFPETFYYQPYYYCVFLGSIYFIFGKIALYAVIVIQSLLSAATVFLTGICGRKIFSERAGLVAAALIAISSSLILYVPYHQNETLQTFHLILLFYLTLSACEKKSWQWWSLSGFVAGIAILTRGNIWVLIPGILAAGVMCGAKQRKTWLNCTLFIFCMLAVQLPFIIRNSLACGELRGPSTAADAVLALGNGADAPAGGRNAEEAAGAMYYSESYRRMMANTSGEYAVSVPAQMRDWFYADPAGFLELQFRKALLFWDGREIPNNVSLDYDGCRYSLILRTLILGRNHFLLAIGIGGILWFIPVVVGKRKIPGVKLLYTFVILFYISAVAFYILSRFKAPVLPLLAVAGGGALCEWGSELRKKQWKSRLAVVCIIVFSVWMTSRAYDLYRDMESGIQRIIHPNGIILDLNSKDVLYLDHGPQPQGGWQEVELLPGMQIEKYFATLKTVPAELQIMMINSEAAQIIMSVNGKIIKFSLPPFMPGKSVRKTIRFQGCPVINGKYDIQIISVIGGKVFTALDIQRNYGRSRGNGTVLNGEWVIRTAVPKSFMY